MDTLLMKTALLAILVVLTQALHAASIDRARLLDAIAAVENSHGRTGRQGETTPHQLLPAVLRQHGSAENYLEWMVQYWRKKGTEPTVYLLALSWNAGPIRVAHGRPVRASYDYAERVRNYYEMLKREKA